MACRSPVAAHLATAYSLAYAIGTPILATLTGAADRKRVILGALGLFLVGNIAAAASSSFAVLPPRSWSWVPRPASIASTAQAAAIMIAGVEHRAKAVAAVVGGTTFAVALGAPLGSLVGHLAGWRATFLFVGLIARDLGDRARIDAAARPRRREAHAVAARAGDRQARHPAGAGHHLPLPHRRLHRDRLHGRARHRRRRAAADDGAGDAARLRRRRGGRQLCQRPAHRPARRDARGGVLAARLLDDLHPDQPDAGAAAARISPGRR